MLAVVVAAVLLVAPFAGSDPVEEAAAALRSDPVFVDPAAERGISAAEADDLRAYIRDSGQPIFVAVLPASAAPDEAAANALPRQLATATGLTGDYAVVAGDRFRATSGAAATHAFQAASGDGTAAVLERYVDEVVAIRSGSGAGSAGTASEAEDEEGSLLPVALVGVGAVGLYAVVRKRRTRDRQAAAALMANEIQSLRAELSVLSSDVLRLEPEVPLHPDARNDYEAAVDRFRAASAALDYADDRVDLVRVARVIDEARYAMARARAFVGGYEPPPPPDELRRPGRHDEPPLDLDEEGRPVYAGGGVFYGGGGWFGGGGGGVLTGLMIGSMLGGPWGMFGGGWGHVQDHGGSGDFGGGSDWGGGDFGGGDFGGGDIGGGDWG